MQCLGNGFNSFLGCFSDYQLNGYKGIAGNAYCGQRQSVWE